MGMKRLSKKQKQVVLDQMWKLLREDEAKPEDVEDECGITEFEYQQAVQQTIWMLEKQWGISSLIKTSVA